MNTSFAGLVVALLASTLAGLGVGYVHASYLHETLGWLKDEIKTRASNEGSGACRGADNFTLSCSG